MRALWSMLKPHLTAIIVAVATTGALGLFGHYVSAQTVTAVLARRVDDTEARLTSLEEALQAVAQTQSTMAVTTQDLATTQRMVIEMVREQRALHDADVRELRARRRR